MSEVGPWEVDVWPSGALVLQSQDFTHDVALEISGDFASDEQKRAYAEEIARRLNSCPGESFPPAVSAEYDKGISRLAITLDNGLVFTVSPTLIKGLEKARVEDLLVSEISPSGYGIHFPLIDADFYIQALFAKGIRCGVNIGSKASGNLNTGMNELEHLLNEYFDCGVLEGREHREHDTEDGAAQKALNAIRECVSRMILAERDARAERARHL